MSNSPSRRLLAASSALLALALSIPAQDDRENSAPTGHALYAGLDAQQVGNLLNNGYRIVDLEVDPAQAGPFTVSLVPNSGSFARTWWWYYGLTLQQVGSYVSSNQARLTDLERYEVNGQTRFACVMESNTGANAKAWWYQTGITWNALLDFCSSHQARIVDLDTELVNGVRYYTAVMVRNTGEDQRAWWVYSNIGAAAVANALTANNAYLRDLEVLENGNFAVVMQARQGKAFWWYYGQTLSEIWFKARQNGARLIDIERYEVNGVTRYAGIMLNSANALTARVGELMRDATDGVVGVYLKQVGGGVRASLLGDWSFEPASMLKTLHHVHAMRRVSQGQLSLDAVWNVATSTNGSCPTGGAPFVNETVRDVLRQMMENSSNTRTMRVTNQYGMAALNQTAQALGMTGTALNHHIGCGGPVANELTLVDLGRLHEEVAQGYLGVQRQNFYDLMLNSLGGYPASGTLKLDDLIDAEAAALNLPAGMVATFKANCELAYKGGSYTVDGKQYRSIGGYVSLPVVVLGQVSSRNFVTGAFAHGASDGGQASAAVGVGAIEVLRDEVRAALQTWVGVTFGSFTSFGSGCQGSGGVPVQSTVGNPTIGQLATYRLFHGPAARPVTMFVGASKTQWNALALPLSLAAFGAPGCSLRVSPDVSLGLATNGAGQATLPLVFPNQPALIGASFHSQFLCLDPGVNQLGLTTSDGVTTLLGGAQ
ncbi:MAG: serine hydrolase [Planctomycetes bacterium]|nr:serine hydrolase [Planctomycetota bacterium]